MRGVILVKKKQKFLIMFLVSIMLMMSMLSGCSSASGTQPDATDSILAVSPESTQTGGIGSTPAPGAENTPSPEENNTPANTSENTPAGESPAISAEPATAHASNSTEASTAAPTTAPTANRTAASTAAATAAPTARLTTAPTAKPTAAPTAKPTAAPTAKPTATPKPFEFEKRNDYVWMTYNIKTQNGSTLEAVSDRAAALCDFLKRLQPDVVGVQEATRLWRENITMSGTFTAQYYNMVGEERNNTATDNEANPILYRKDRFDLLDSGTFWLSETPDQMSKGFGAAYYRICTWVKLKDKNSGQVLVFMNTHLDTTSKDVRTAEFNLILEKAQSFGNVPIILTGDFNIRQDAALYKTIQKTMFKDSKTVAKSAEDASSKVAEYYSKSDNRPIDYVFVTSHWNVSSYKLDPGEYKGRSGAQTNISDHCAVYIRATVG